MDLYVTLAKFYLYIYKLLIVYNWQEAVFSMAMEAHIFVVIQQLNDLLKRVIPEKFQDMFYTSGTMKGMNAILEGGGWQ